MLSWVFEMFRLLHPRAVRLVLPGWSRILSFPHLHPGLPSIFSPSSPSTSLRSFLYLPRQLSLVCFLSTTSRSFLRDYALFSFLSTNLVSLLTMCTFTSGSLHRHERRIPLLMLLGVLLLVFFKSTRGARTHSEEKSTSPPS